MDSECGWRLCAIQRSDEIEDWALEVDLSGAFALSPGLSSISFTIDGERVNGEADMLLSVLILCILTLSLMTTHNDDDHRDTLEQHGIR